MGWFNVVKGAYPVIDMVTLDRSIQDSAGGRAIVRGSSMALDANSWRVTTVSSDTTTKTPVYFALQAASDLSAQFAGSVALPKITGIPCNYPMEVETDQFDPAGTYTIGCGIGPGDAGKVINRAAGVGNTMIGFCTAVPYRRWINDAVAVPGYRTGNNVNVIRFMTCFIPALA